MTLRPAGQYDFESASVAAAEITGVIALLMAASPPPGVPGHRRALHEGTPTAVRRARTARRWT
jgi:hypothetical protein